MLVSSRENSVYGLILNYMIPQKPRQYSSQNAWYGSVYLIQQLTEYAKIKIAFGQVPYTSCNPQPGHLIYVYVIKHEDL